MCSAAQGRTDGSTNGSVQCVRGKILVLVVQQVMHMIIVGLSSSLISKAGRSVAGLEWHWGSFFPNPNCYVLLFFKSWT